MMRLYNSALFPLRMAAELRALFAPGGRRREWSQRLGRSLPSVPPAGAWLHGASVGEARLARALAAAIRDVRPDLPLATSAVTRTGRGQLPEPPEVDASFFAPLDFRGGVRSALATVRPALLGLIETELWPNLLAACHHDGVRVAVVNGRISDRRLGRYRRFARLFRPLLATVAAVGAQSDTDADRFAELGVPRDRITTLGNLKYDLPAPSGDLASLRRRFGLTGEDPVWVAGSTAPGEDEIVLRAFDELRRDHPGLILALAPRHPERVPAVSSLVTGHGLPLTLRSQGGGPVGPGEVLILDTLGELASLYGAATVAFVGGTLTDVGGHNVLEPAAAGIPILIGPHVQNVKEPAEALLAAGGAARVDADSLEHRLRDWLDDPAARQSAGDAAQSVVACNRGTLLRARDLLLDLLVRAG